MSMRQKHCKFFIIFSIITDIDVWEAIMDHKLIEKYTKTYGVRFTRRQKKKFIKDLCEEFESIGYSHTMIEGKKLFSRAENYLFGNLKQMKTIIVAPYDTPERKFWNKVVYYPFDGNKTASKTVVATYLPIGIVFAILFLGLYGLQPLVTSIGLSALLSVFLFLLTIMLMYWMLHGFHNSKNYNRNSASIVAALEIARSLNKEEKRKIGFAFTDKNKLRFAGAESFAQDLVNQGKNPSLICLDCIAKGSEVQIGFNPQNRKLATEIAKYHPEKKQIELVKLDDQMRLQNAMSHYKKAVVISSGELDKNGSLVVNGTGTGKDCEIDMHVLENNIKMVREYLQNQK